MAVTTDSNGNVNIAATSTVYSAKDITSAGVWQYGLDLNPLAADDVVAVRLFYKPVSGGTQRLMLERLVGGGVAPTEKILLFPAFPLPASGSLELKVEQLNGTAVGNVAWWLTKIA